MRRCRHFFGIGQWLRPTVAIGDITPEDCPAIRTTGVAGIAMVRAFVDNPALQA